MKNNQKNFSVSYSKIKTFNQCKYLYYKIYVLKEKSEDNKYTAFGKVMHRFLELLYKRIKDNQKKYRDNIIECYTDILREFGPLIELFKIENDIQQYIKYFYKNIDVLNFFKNTIKTEERVFWNDITEENNKINIISIIDRIDLVDSKYFIYDYKTNKDVGRLDNNQLYLYAYIIDRVYNTNIDTCGYVYVCDNYKIKNIKVSDDNKKDVINYIRRESDKIITFENEVFNGNLEVVQRNMSYLCKFCQYKEECEKSVCDIFNNSVNITIRK